MDFENMRIDCPWLTETPKGDRVDRRCRVDDRVCLESNCAPFHWIGELANNLHVLVNAEIRTI